MGDDLGEFGEKEAPSHVVEQLLGKSWGELEVLEHAGYLLFPDNIYKRRKDGTFDSVKVMLRLPRQHELRKARVQARGIAVKDGIDLDRDRDLFGDVETVCILAMAIRNSTPPHEPMIPDPLELERDYDRACLMQVWAKIDALHRLVDPAPHEIGEREMFALVAAIAKERSIYPLAVYAADLQATFVVTMACLLNPLLEPKPSSEQ
jgi:hypothetical protein